MTRIALMLALIRWAEVVHRRYVRRITGRRADRFFQQIRYRVSRPEQSPAEEKDHKEVIAALRSSERAFKRTRP